MPPDDQVLIDMQNDDLYLLVPNRVEPLATSASTTDRKTVISTRSMQFDAVHGRHRSHPQHVPQCAVAESLTGSRNLSTLKEGLGKSHGAGAAFPGT